MARTIVKTESVTCDVCGRAIFDDEWRYEVRVRPRVDNCLFQTRVLDLCKDCFAPFKTYVDRGRNE
jgi:hypothetical protein